MTATADPAPHHRALARHVAAVFGGSPRVVEYADRLERRFVGVLSSADRPVAGVTSYSTIKLSDHAMPWGDGEFAVRIELAGACANSATQFPNLLASTAFHIMQSAAVYHPGTVIENIARESGVSSTLPHVYLATPLLWGKALVTFEIDGGTVAWLLAMPISEAERQYLRERGEQALESRFDSEQIDLFDPERPGTV
jgi:antitoxin YqcF